MSRFANKVALVTGAASGIGAAVTQQLIDDGATVVLFDLNAAAVESAATALGDKALAHAGDVTNEDDVKAAVDAAVAKFGKLDSAFNIAGLAKIGTITDGSVADWNATVSVVLGGTYLVTRYSALAMRAGGNGGAIVNVSSLNAHVPLYGGSSYAAAKAGVEAFTKNSARSPEQK
ncbi:MAG TPA: SDR family NAD(P)-dependent oxidoreductase [Gordonia sp. (in: high G+C Gram-positive bacteria)]|uniref:SDR family NAD(P)-dependent oxidoreductase n=1 Tax=unclassified Gordonia (in: high G+C Gram-positive bacteria) TaxID=2657482 RepID=UPI000F914458|nr:MULTISPECIES: SDR family NAD(P)-dependent oxidoreductase [unclassified Gordonia (in: high G+C Gram-positive bacteria)]RUP39165.1 MAG: SDR family NAD(P)-dependent oxidoreductase [Gordonia sp. (in: high G+C Gram-positive bacteria)]HNP56787.1 SDR family NAD(P)-dependent oxidoreductase [Gordonia sp. (in: high G+C Gram-positive bacteria)]HRC49910.1 SDR family NAD(P)-dependent oxidoreductase [Gordonia sp. (in: high G+C Gram-positive bacteria)]